MPDLRSLVASADGLRVDALVQTPWCAKPMSMTVRQTCDLAVERSFDILPIEDADGQILSTIATLDLQAASSWDDVLPHRKPLTPDRLVAREAPVLRLLERLERHEILFTLGRGGVDGVVTIFDLNQPAAHLFGFGMALICEADVTEALRAELGEEPDVAHHRAAQILKNSRSLAAWMRARAAGQELHVASRLTFGEKLAVLRENGLAVLAASHGVAPAALDAELRDICDLRNAIGHYNHEDDDHLKDPQWTMERMKLAQRFADRVIARRS